MDGGRAQGGGGLHRPGEHCQQPPTSPITLHPILPSYPLSLLTLPHIQTVSCSVCVYASVHLSFISVRASLVDACIRGKKKKKGDVARFFVDVFVFYDTGLLLMFVSEIFLVSMARVGGNISK